MGMQRAEILRPRKIDFRHPERTGTVLAALHLQFFHFQILICDGAKSTRAFCPFGFLLGLRVLPKVDVGEYGLGLFPRLISIDGWIVTDPQAASAALNPILNDPALSQPSAITARPESKALQVGIEEDLIGLAVVEFEFGDGRTIKRDLLTIH